MYKKILSITLQNLQSWNNSTLPLGSGLNVLQADNNVGKSVIMKCFSILSGVDNRYRRKSDLLIRDKQDKAMFILELEDKYLAGFILIKGNNVIYLYGPDLSSLNKYTSPPQEMLQKVGLITQGDYLFNLVVGSSNLLVTSNSELDYLAFQKISQSEDLEKIIEISTEKLDILKREVAMKKSQKAAILSEINYYNMEGLEEQERSLALISKLRKALLYSNKLLENSKVISVPTTLHIEERLFNSLSILNSMKKHIDMLSTIDKSYEEIEKVLYESNRIIECPVKGKVLFGKECVEIE